jgi:(2Fe-2S) ferredoxin
MQKFIFDVQIKKMSHTMRFEKHLFICTHDRPPGEKKSCGQVHGLELVKLFKKAIADKGLNVSIRAQRAGCLDACDFGPALVVYPDGIYYGSVSFDDVDEIVTQHLIHNQPVERLIIRFPSKKA